MFIDIQTMTFAKGILFAYEPFGEKDKLIDAKNIY
jgi:hypothetical protein